jgi:hypothetical protein
VIDGSRVSPIGREEDGIVLSGCAEPLVESPFLQQQCLMHARANPIAAAPASTMKKMPTNEEELLDGIGPVMFPASQARAEENRKSIALNGRCRSGKIFHFISFNRSCGLHFCVVLACSSCNVNYNVGLFFVSSRGKAKVPRSRDCHPRPPSTVTRLISILLQCFRLVGLGFRRFQWS